MKSQKEITAEVRRIRDRIRGFSGYWIGEAVAAITALEWVTGKRPEAPSEDLGTPGGAHERVAASLLKSVEKTPPPKPRARPRAAPARAVLAAKRKK